MLSEIFDKSILIFGCGNILLGDDGFGPAVVKRLNDNHALPEHALALDMGTGVREVLFDLILSESKPEKIIIVDAVDHPGRQPGEVFEIAVEDIPAKKIADFSLHQFPTVNMLKELKDHTGIDITILAAQVQEIPEELREGLTPPLAAAVEEACRRILRNI
ncbi:MAG: hydrogenase maturation protease [Deltaproteobacteria bacterium]|nr:hydrogenase maturation protease [Deltaproteobacteria bacterium]